MMDTESPKHAQALPCSSLHTDTLQEKARFAMWRDSILPLFEPIPDGSSTPDPFHAHIEVFHLQHLLLGMSSFSRQRFRRTAVHCAGDCADHFLIQMRLKGGCSGHNGHQAVHGGFGDITLLDLSRPMETRIPASTHLSLVVPRQLFHSRIKGGVCSGTRLAADSPLGRVVGNHLLSVWRSLPSATVADSQAIMEMLLGVVAGAFNATTDIAETHTKMSDRATLDAIRYYIDQNLESATLTPAHLCEHFGCSRAQLYRLFQPQGGIATYIREARLKRCLFELTRSAHASKRIAAVASRWGFSNQSHFCRLFREAFGITPGDASAMGCYGTVAVSRATGGQRDLPLFRDWLVNL